MEEYSEKLLAILPEDGTKISGGVAKEACGLKRSDYDAAKKELKELGLITLGRGRGGTLSAIVGAERPVEAPKLSPAEKRALAFEEKKELTKAQKERQTVRDMAEEKAAELYPDAEEIQVTVADVDMGKAWITVWTDKEGRVGPLYV